MSSIEERLQRLEDYEAIRRTFVEYIFALDSMDWEGLGQVFTSDAVVEIAGYGDVVGEHDLATATRNEGREAVVNAYKSWEANASPANGQYYTGHNGVNMKIDLEGDEATTLAYFLEILGTNGFLAGTYQHRMRREGGRWRIAYLRISNRYSAQLEVKDPSGLSLRDVLDLPAV
jgi:hypothetical protein